MKFFIRITVVGYILGGLILWFGPSNWWPDFYRVPSMAILAFISAIIIIAAEVVLRSKDEDKNKALNIFKTTLLIGLLINAAGGLGLYNLYKVGFQYDKLTHFVTPAIFTIGTFYLFYGFFKFNWKKSFYLAVAIVFASGIVWEFFEHFSNKIFTGDVFVLGGGMSIWEDTIWDVIFNTLGISLAAAYLIDKHRNQKKHDVTF